MMHERTVHHGHMPLMSLPYMSDICAGTPHPVLASCGQSSHLSEYVTHPGWLCIQMIALVSNQKVPLLIEVALRPFVEIRG